MRFSSARPVLGLLLLATVATATAAHPLRAEINAAGASPPMLNSERILQQFGSYGIELLISDGRLRIANLYSNEPEGRICRSFAVTRYPSVIKPGFADEHAAILAGGSIGAVFAAAGWEVQRQHLWLGEVPPSAQVLELMGGLTATPLAVHIFELVVTRDAASYTYATIAEVHHPDYLSLQDLEAIFGTEWRATTRADAAAEALAVVLEAMRRHDFGTGFTPTMSAGITPVHADETATEVLAR